MVRFRRLLAALLGVALGRPVVSAAQTAFVPPPDPPANQLRYGLTRQTDTFTFQTGLDGGWQLSPLVSLRTVALGLSRIDGPLGLRRATDELNLTVGLDRAISLGSPWQLRGRLLGVSTTSGATGRPVRWGDRAQAATLVGLGRSGERWRGEIGGGIGLAATQGRERIGPAYLLHLATDGWTTGATDLVGAVMLAQDAARQQRGELSADLRRAFGPAADARLSLAANRSTVQRYLDEIARPDATLDRRELGGTVGLDLRYRPGDAVGLALGTTVGGRNIVRTLGGSGNDLFSRSPIPAADLPYVPRDIEERQVGGWVELARSGTRLTASVRLGGRLETETDRLRLADGALSVTDRDRLRLEIARGDKRRQQNDLSARAVWRPGRRTRVALDGVVNRLRYDTPSTAPGLDDDRDDLTGLVQLDLSRRASAELTYGLALRADGTHTVYLNSTRSGTNGWIRTLRLSPRLLWEPGPNLTLAAGTEVSAQYSVRDFRSLNLGPTTDFASRQVAFRDSIRWQPVTGWSVEGGFDLRRNVRGTLDWDRFAERPTLRIDDRAARLRVAVAVTRDLTVAPGWRFYGQTRRPLDEGTPSAAVRRSFSNGPTTTLRWRPGPRTSVAFDGWLEHRTLPARTVPDAALTVVWAW